MFDRKSLFLNYVKVGLIQFGRFKGQGDTYSPIAYYFTLLPSFPALLNATAEAMEMFFRVENPQERLLTAFDTIALGAVLASRTGMPMLYPRNDTRSYTSAFTIEGTADVANPVYMLSGVLTDGEIEIQVAGYAAQVGLPVSRIVVVMDTEQGGKSYLRHNLPAISLSSLFTLSECLSWLLEAGVITGYMKEKLVHTISG